MCNELSSLRGRFSKRGPKGVASLQATRGLTHHISELYLTMSAAYPQGSSVAASPQRSGIPRAGEQGAASRMQQRRLAASSERCHGQGASRADVPSDVAARTLVPSVW